VTNGEPDPYLNVALKIHVHCEAIFQVHLRVEKGFDKECVSNEGGGATREEEIGRHKINFSR